MGRSVTRLGRLFKMSGRGSGRFKLSGMGSRRFPGTDQQSWWTMASTYFQSLGLLPALKIGPQYEELSTDLNDPHALIFNDSAEVAHGKTRQLGRIGNVQEGFFDSESVGCFHGSSLIL